MASHKKKKKNKFTIPNLNKDLKDLAAGKLVKTSAKMGKILAYVEARGL